LKEGHRETHIKRERARERACVCACVTERERARALERERESETHRQTDGERVCAGVCKADIHKQAHVRVRQRVQLAMPRAYLIY